VELREETAKYVRGRPVPAAPPPAGAPTASVIIRVGADVARARLALEAVLANTGDRPYEVIVVDAASDGATREYVEIVAARNRHVRVLGDHGEALAVARGDIVVLLDDGTIIAPGWLEGLAEHLGDPTVGLVSPATNRSLGGAHGQIAYGTYGEMVRLARRRREELTCRVTEVEAVDLSCVAFRRDLLDEVGPLVEHGSAAIETIEDDFARRVRAAGHRVVRAEDVFAHRLGGATLGIVPGRPEVPTSEVVSLPDDAVAAVDRVWSSRPPSWMQRAGKETGPGAVGDEERRAVAVAAPGAAAVTSSGDHPRLALAGPPPEARTAEPTAPVDDAAPEGSPTLAPPPASQPADADGEAPAETPKRPADEGGGGSRRLSPATLLYIAAACISAGLLVYWTSKQTFLVDEWSFLLDRRGFSAGTFFDPHNEHIVVIPVAIYKLLLAAFGMTSAVPFHVTAIAIFIATVSVVFVALRRLISDWLALACVLPLLFFGSASESLLLTFQLSFSLSLCFGVGALLALQWPGLRHRDAITCLLLVLSILSVSLGLAFALAVGAWLLVTPGGRRRLWVPLVPLAVYGLWWLGWGHTAESTVSLQSIVTTPSYVLDGLATSLASLLGLTAGATDTNPGALDWGRPLLVAAAAIAAWRAWQLRKEPDYAWTRPLLVGVVVLALSFWTVAGVNGFVLRPAFASRYQLAGASFLLLIAAVLAGRRRLSRTALVAVFAVAVLSTAANLWLLHDEWKKQVDLSRLQRAALTALDVERDRVSPSFEINAADTNIPFADIVRAGPYFDASDAYGSPAYSLSELASAPEYAREAADRTVARELGIAPEPSGPQRSTACRTAKLGAAPVVGDVPPGGATFWVEPGSSASLTLGRFASGYPVDLGELRNGTSKMSIPSDAVGQPWRFQLLGAGPVRVCALRD
jgi:hypothetical protein